MSYPFPIEKLPSPEVFRATVPVSCRLVNELTPTQYVVRIDRMLWLDEGNDPDGNDVPHVVRWQGVIYLYDGHHRWMLAKLRMQHQIHVRLFEMGE